MTSISNTASSPAVLGTQIYGPYGNKRTSAGTIGTAKGYTGQYNDDVTGLDYYNARYYDPVIGRFLSADSIQGNLSGMDPYAYVGGNPETETDPSGQLNYAPGSGMAWTPGSTTTYYWGQPFGSQQSFSSSSRPQGSTTPITWKGGQYQSNGGQKKSTGSSSPPVKKNTWNQNQNNGCPGGNTTSDCSKITITSLQIQDHQITIQTPFGFSVTFHFQTVSLSSHTFCTNPLACLDEGQNHSKGESESHDTTYGSSGACGMLSFTPQTAVATDQGKRPISKLRPGDQVWAYNPQTHKMELQPILHVWIHQDDDLVDLTITSTQPTSHDKSTLLKEEVVHTNKKHPFLTTEKGFLPVGQITVGMHVQRADGSIGIVTGWTLVPGVKTMYNLEVAQDHTFTVGDGRWVVHNSSCVGPDWIKKLPTDPQELIDEGWQDVTHPNAKAKSNSTELFDPATGRKVRFDKGVPGKPGFRGADHYHVYNPSSTGKGDLYLDENGNPVPRNSDSSHILPG